MSSTSGFDSTRLCAHKRTHGRIVALALTLLAGTSHAVFAADPPPYVDPGKQGDPASWVTNEFKANWGLGAINAQNAYSLGITGAGVKVGIFDSALAANPEFAGPNKLTFLETPLGQGAGTGGYTAGYIGANRNGAGAQGVAFGANLFMSSGAALGIAKPTPAGIAAAFAPFVQNGIHIIDNNQVGVVAANLGDLVKQYGAATPWLKSIVDQARDNDLLLITPVGANNFSPGGIFGGGVVASTIPGLIASLPYFNSDMLGHAIAVKDLGNVAPIAGFLGIGSVYSMAIPGVPSLDGSSYSNNCAQTRAWCVSAPGSNVPGLTTILDLTQYIDAYNYSKASFWNDYYAVYTKYSQYDAYLNPTTKTWLAPIQAGPVTSSAMAAAAVTGEAALIQQRFPWMTVTQVSEVVLSSATYLPDGSDVDKLPGNKAAALTQIPNATYGWGVIDAGKAMGGPGQLFGYETFTIPEGVTATFSNPISNSWLTYQQTVLDPPANDAWQAEMKAKGWENGLPAGASAADQAEYNYQSGLDDGRFFTDLYTGELEKDGPGTLILTGPNTYDGGTMVEDGVLQGNATSLQGDIEVYRTAKLVFLQDMDGSFVGAISGPGAVAKAGIGKLTLAGDNSFKGTFNIDAGVVAISAANNIGRAPVVMNGGGLEFDAPLTFANAITLAADGTFDAEADTTISGAIAGPGALTKTGASTLTLTGDNHARSAALNLNGGLLAFASQDNLGTGPVAMNGGGLRFNQTVTLANAITLADGTGTFDTEADATIPTVIAGPGTLVKTGAATLTLTAANTYSGGTTISAGTLSGNATTEPGDIHVDDGGTMMFTQDADGTYAGALSGAGSVVKSGTGRLTFSGGNNAGANSLRIDAGTIAIAAANNMTTGPISLSGATLELDGPVALVNDVTLAGGGTFDVRADTAISGAITGDGGLIKRGDATLILSGVSTFAGPVDITGVLVMSGANTFADAFDVRGGKLVMSGDNTFGGPVKLDGDAFTLSEANSFADAFKVKANTLDMGGNNKFSGAVDLDGGAFTLSGANVFGGPLDLNSGTLTLSGANSFAGPVDVNAGLLVLRGGLAVGDATPVIVAGPGTLEVDNAERVGSVAGSGGIVLKDALYTGGDNTDTALSGVISGTGELVKEGSGIFTVSGPNTYSGGTEIEGGTLKGDTTSLGGGISNNALLYFAQNFDGTFAGSITGGGAIEKGGEGTLALTGDNSGSSGAIKIGAGRVIITSAANIGTGVITLDNGALEIDERTDLANDFHLGTGHQMLVIKKVSALPGTMSGEGGITKAGPGTLSLTGTNTYAGDTDIQEGLVNVDGVQTASRSVVERDATLGGSGTSHGILAKAGSTLAPGHSIGTMYSDDAGIQMDAGSTYHVEISPFGRSDKLVTTGKATIDYARLLITREFVQAEMAQADLAAIVKPGKLVILSAADGVSGTFDTIYPSFAFLNLGVTYQKTFVDLNVGRNPISFEEAGMTPNERSVGAAIEGLKGVHPIYNVLLTVPTLADAAMLEQEVSGEIHADVAGEVLSDSAVVRDAVFDRMATRAPGTSAFWVHGLYGTGTTSADGNAVKLDRRTYGVVGGVDQTIGGTWLIGIGGGYEQTPLKTATMGTAQVDSYHAAAYGGGDLFGVSLYLGGAYGRYEASTARNVDIAGLVAAENAQYGVNQGQAFGRIGIPIAMDDATIEPFVSGSYNDASIDKFVESAGPVALENRGQTIDRTQSVAGFRSSMVFYDDDAIFTPNLTLGWIHNFDSTATGVRLGFAGGMDSNSFLVDGVATNTEAGLVQAGLDASIGSGISLGIGYAGQFGDREQDQAVHVNIKANY